MAKMGKTGCPTEKETNCLQSTAIVYYGVSHASGIHPAETELHY
jgi:hypothetical protein